MHLKLLFRLSSLNKHRMQAKKILIFHRYFHDNVNATISNVSASQLKQIIKQHNNHFVDGHVCIIMDCPICNIDKLNGSKVYINKTTGYFICDKCSCKGSWDILEKFIKQERNTIKELIFLKGRLLAKEKYLEKWEEIARHGQTISMLTEDTYERVLSVFNFPNVPQEKMAALKCVYESTTSTLYFPLMAFGNCIVGYKSLSIDKEKEETFPTANTNGIIMYKSKSMKSSEVAVLVPTIPDLLALVSQKIDNAVICLPYNVQQLPQQLLPNLECFKKLILWFGNDIHSWHASRHFAKKLNERRCYFVRPMDSQPTPKIAVETGCNLKNILQNAQSVYHQSITTFHNLRTDVLSDLQNVDKVQGIKWKRYPTLNRILRGHRRGEFTVLTGPTGSGKTTFMSEYSLDLSMQGVNTLWGSFEIRNTRLARTMLQQMAGVSLEENLESFDYYADEFEKLPVYFMTFHGQQNIKVVMDAVEHATYVHDIAHVIIDNVQFMMGISEESQHQNRFWKQDKIISSFRNFATKYDCHVTLVIHPRKERNDEELTTSSIFGSAKATQEADNVLIIQDKRLASVRGKKYLQVAKNRYSGDLGIMVLDFDKTSLSYAEKKKPKSDSSKELDEPVPKEKRKKMEKIEENLI